MFDQAILTVVVIKVFQQFKSYWYNLVISWEDTLSTFLCFSSQPAALIFSNISRIKKKIKNFNPTPMFQPLQKQVKIMAR